MTVRVRCGRCRAEFEAVGPGRHPCPVCGVTNEVLGVKPDDRRLGSPPPAPAPPGGGRSGKRLLYGWGIAVAVIVLAASAVVISRERGSEQDAAEGAAMTSPAVEADTVPAVQSTVAARLPATTLLAAEGPPPTAAAAAAGAVAQPGAAVDWSELALSVVFVEAAGCPSLPYGMVYSGSGTVVLDGRHVLTNAHVVHDDWGEPCRDLYVWYTTSFEREPSDWIPAELLYADGQLDLAVLRLENAALADKTIEVTAQQLAPGEDIRILGYPDDGGMTMTLTRGAYSGRFNYEGVSYLKTDTDISVGNSGGAAFDEAGVFIGVPTAVLGGVGMLIPAEAAERFLARALDYNEDPPDDDEDAALPEEEDELPNAASVSSEEEAASPAAPAPTSRESPHQDCFSAIAGDLESGDPWWPETAAACSYEMFQAVWLTYLDGDNFDGDPNGPYLYCDEVIWGYYWEARGVVEDWLLDTYLYVCP